MIGKGIKNYFVNLKYYFTPLGAFALGVVMGLSVFIPITLSSVNDLAKTAAEISGSASVDFTALFDCLSDAVFALDWSKPTAAISTVLNEKWLGETFHACVTSLIPNGEMYAEQIVAAVTEAVNSVVAGFVVPVFFAILGIMCGYAFTKFLIRRSMARRTWWKYFIASFVETVINAVFLAVTVWLRFLWRPGSLIFAIVSLTLIGFASLTEAHILHGWKKLDWRKVINIKNVGKLLLTDFITFGIAFVVFVILIVVFGAFVGVFAGLPFVMIALLVMSLNAEAYVKGVAEQESQVKAAVFVEEKE